MAAGLGARPNLIAYWLSGQGFDAEEPIRCREPLVARTMIVWGIPASRISPAIVVTAYRPDPAKWDESGKRRRT